MQRGKKRERSREWALLVGEESGGKQRVRASGAMRNRSVEFVAGRPVTRLLDRLARNWQLPLKKRPTIGPVDGFPSTKFPVFGSTRE